MSTTATIRNHSIYETTIRWRNRFSRAITAPHKIPEMISNWQQDNAHSRTFNPNLIETQQEAAFARIGLNRPDGIRNYKHFLESFNNPENSSFSEHSILFAALSATDHKIMNILEFGTYDAANSLLLSHLFPNATIKTIDLPDTHPAFADTYNRGNNDARNAFIKRRHQNLLMSPNVTFVQNNSISETFSTDVTYDLIWVDGAHGYPLATIDIVNAIRMLSRKGILMCDDVYTPANETQSTSDGMYRSIASFETLQAFHEERFLTLDLIDKRIDECSTRARNRKFVSFSRKSK